MSSNDTPSTELLSFLSKIQPIVPASSTYPNSGFTIDTDITSSRPFIFKIVNAPVANGHAREIKRWYLPDSAGNLTPDSLLIHSLNYDSALTKFPFASVLTGYILFSVLDCI